MKTNANRPKARTEAKRKKLRKISRQSRRTNRTK